MNRRSFVRMMGGGAGACLLSAAAPRPNVVVMLVDDMGFSDLGCYGSEIPTPNLDRLAARGVRFTQFYNTARCSPSRACLLTGLYPHQAGMGHLDNDVRPDREAIRAASTMKAPPWRRRSGRPAILRL